MKSENPADDRVGMVNDPLRPTHKRATQFNAFGGGGENDEGSRDRGASDPASPSLHLGKGNKIIQKFAWLDLELPRRVPRNRARIIGARNLDREDEEQGGLTAAGSTVIVHPRKVSHIDGVFW